MRRDRTDVRVNREIGVWSEYLLPKTIWSALSDNNEDSSAR